MSINSAMLAGVSGLVANASALASISDNIANVNTVAYKRNQTNFSSVVTAQAVPGHYSAGGTQAITRQLVSTQGLIQTANSATDIAINGDGFFVVTNKGLGLADSDQRLFTRSGSFSVDANGYLVNDAKLYLQGWPVEDGVATPDPSDLTSMQPINVKSLGTAVAPTSLVQLTASLFKNQTVSAGEAAYDPTVTPTTSMAQYADDIANNAVVTGTKPDFTMEMSITDSSGGTHKVALAVLKGATPNEWHAEVYAVPATDVTGGASPGLIGEGKIMFTSNGDFDPVNSGGFFANLSGSMTPSFSLGNSATGAAPKWATSLGLSDQTITLDLSKLSQVVEASQLKSVNSDGAGVGNVIAVQVDDQGFVSAIFDNKQVRKIAQIGLATFPNPDGLKPSSGNTYSSAIPAGVMVAKAPGTAGAGVISPSSLEASTVDLSQEFTGLITTQKAYSASSKIITTADQMLDELIQMKR
ncbi:flagellar hook protein FlgE [Phenylobacterium sp. LjRoot225]|uniref:flagellar hook-basal body complex protein n=1 Tax=Phenylobacterium sp. LjRoot225 TaxID=3342285 RepID=UPI003ED1245E